ncbi:multidrug effflux MFS transporter [Mycolicibacterium sediminis]
MTPISPTAPFPISWLWVLALLTAVGPLSVDMYLPDFPAMTAEFGAAPSATQVTLMTFMVGMATGQLVGPLSDRWGRRPLLLMGTVLCTAAGAACALAPSVGLLAVFRFLQGFGGAAGVVLSRAMVSDRAEGAAAARIFSLMMIINGAAPIVAPLIGGGLSGLIGWRGVFWILTALAVVMVLGATFVLSETHPASGHSKASRANTLREGENVLGNRHYVGYTLAFAFGFSVMFAFISASPFVLQTILGLSTVGNGIAVAANAFGLLAMNAVNARIVGRFGQRRLLTTGTALMAVFSSLVLVDAVAGPTIWVMLPLLWCTVTSLGLVVANATSLALDQVRRVAGTGSAVLGLLQYSLAAIVSPLVGLAGSATAVPMAITMTACALVAVGAVQLARSP